MVQVLFSMRESTLANLGQVSCYACNNEMRLESRVNGGMQFRCKSCRKTLAYRDIEKFMNGVDDQVIL